MKSTREIAEELWDILTAGGAFFSNEWAFNLIEKNLTEQFHLGREKGLEEAIKTIDQCGNVCGQCVVLLRALKKQAP